MAQERIRFLVDNLWIIIAFRIIAVVGLLVASYASIQAKNIANCQIRYNDYVMSRTRILSEFTDRERQIQQDFDKTQAELFGDPAALKPADQRTAEDAERLKTKTVAWINAAVEKDKQRIIVNEARAAHPVPPDPSKVCKL